MITNEQQDRLQELNRVFLEENASLNLSAFRTEEQSWIGNVLDSISILDANEKFSIINSQFSILDMGTGGGFPLLPLAILLPDCQFTGLDSTQKKIDAVQRIIDRMGITNVTLICGRAEELGRDPDFREQYDVVTARALAALNTLVEYCAPFAKVGGHVVAWKSMKIDTELEESLLARAELSCHLANKYEYELPGDWGRRQLLIFDKTFKLSDTYPRKTGVPKKDPLI